MLFVYKYLLYYNRSSSSSIDFSCGFLDVDMDVFIRAFNYFSLTVVILHVTSGEEFEGSDVKSKTASVLLVQKFTYNHIADEVESNGPVVYSENKNNIIIDNSDLDPTVLAKTYVRKDKSDAVNSMDYATIPWQSLRLLTAGCQCPVRFRLLANRYRVWPRYLVVSECLREGFQCSRRAVDTCNTAFSVRTVYNLFTGSAEVRLPVGCLCAVQKAVLAKNAKLKKVE